MKKALYIFICLSLIMLSCKDDDINKFDKSADERVADAIANLKDELTSPQNGWRVLYQPRPDAGKFYILMKFNNDNTVNIQTDLGVDNGKFFNQTITYRIDNSLGLELVLESYSFFSYLFEQNQATFGAEYEFLYVKKEENTLQFKSKTDFSNPTELIFEEARANDLELLGRNISTNINTLLQSGDSFTPAFQIAYSNKDLAFYIYINSLSRMLSISAASSKTSPATFKSIDFTTGYTLKGDSIIMDTPLTGIFFGNSISFNSIKLGSLGNKITALCINPSTILTLQGITSSNDNISIEQTPIDLNGKNFASSDFYVSPVDNIFNNGESAGIEISQDLPGALALQLYYNNDGFYGVGFVLENSDGSISFALREFTPVIKGNNLIFNFSGDVAIFGNPNPDADINNVNKYLDALTSEDQTYVLQYSQGVYEFYNPCSGWSFILFEVKQ